MNKEELLHELAIKLSTGEMSRDDVLQHLNITPTLPQIAPQATTLKQPLHFSFTKMLYVLGAAVVVLGVVLFVGQIWNDIGSAGRIVVTLGLGIVFGAIGSMLMKDRPESGLGAVFHALGGLMIPGGALLTLYEIDSSLLENTWVVATTFGVLFAFYCILALAHKNAVLTFFAIVNGTAATYALISAMLENTTGSIANDIFIYLTIIIGLCYFLLAHGFRGGWNAKLMGALYFFGSFAFLGATFSRVFEARLWELFYFVILLGSFWLSVFLKSRIVLVFSTLFLVAHISYITSEYFADSLGWPIVLVILGFVFIGFGYASFAINKKYIAQ